MPYTGIRKGNYYIQGDRMTRKDYQLIAECIRRSVQEIKDTYGNSNIEDIESHMAVAISVTIGHLQRGLQQDNPNFKPDTFYRACAIEITSI